MYKLYHTFLYGVQVVGYISVQCTRTIQICTVYKLYHTFLYSVPVVPYVHVCTVYSLYRTFLYGVNVLFAVYGQRTSLYCLQIWQQTLLISCYFVGIVVKPFAKADDE